MSNGRVFIEVPVSENAFDLLRLMQVPGEHVTATAARIIEDALQAQSGIERHEGAQMVEYLIGLISAGMNEVFDGLRKMKPCQAEYLARQIRAETGEQMAMVKAWTDRRA